MNGKRISYISEILQLHGKKYIDYESAIDKSKVTAWKYTVNIPRVMHLVYLQPIISSVCEMPISCYQLLIDPTVTWDKPTWTYHDNIKRICTQNGVILQSLSKELQIEYNTLRRQVTQSLTMDCRVLIAIAKFLNLSVDNLLTKELSWEFGRIATSKKHYRKVATARSRILDSDKMLDSWL